MEMNINHLIIRSEQVSDYSQIASINYEAFHSWKPDNLFVSEGILVGILRHHSNFDPELSLVAEQDGEIIGHVFFLPVEIIVKGKHEKGMFIGPVAVKPEYQRLGVGKILVTKGHEIAIEKGITSAFCCGHPEYYPKFGYVTRQFALSGCYVIVKEDTEIKEQDNLVLTERNLEASDITWIEEMWYEHHKDDVLAVKPGSYLSDWTNVSKSYRSVVVMEKDRRIAYIRYQIHDSLEVKELLCKEEDRKKLLIWSSQLAKAKDIKLKVITEGQKLENLIGSKAFLIEDDYMLYDAFMICPLVESEISEYIKDVNTGNLEAAVIALPNIYDIDE